MGFCRHDLQEAFFVPGTHGFRVWGYGTTDTLDEVLRPNYLRGGQSLVHAGDLIYVSTRPGRDPVDGREVGETRVALVMVSAFERGDASVRLVQDFGRPEHGAREAADDGRAVAAGAPGTADGEPGATPRAGAIAPAPAKRGRGRPSGSNSKRKAA